MIPISFCSYCIVVLWWVETGQLILKYGLFQAVYSFPSLLCPSLHHYSGPNQYSVFCLLLFSLRDSHTFIPNLSSSILLYTSNPRVRSPPHLILFRNGNEHPSSQSGGTVRCSGSSGGRSSAVRRGPIQDNPCPRLPHWGADHGSVGCWGTLQNRCIHTSHVV